MGQIVRIHSENIDRNFKTKLADPYESFEKTADFQTITRHTGMELVCKVNRKNSKRFQSILDKDNKNDKAQHW